MKKIITLGLVCTLFLLVACKKKDEGSIIKKDLTGIWNFTLENKLFEDDSLLSDLSYSYSGKIEFSEHKTFELIADSSFLNASGEWFVLENKLYLLFAFNGSSGHYLVYNDNGIVLEQRKQWYSNPRRMEHNKFILTK